MAFAVFLTGCAVEQGAQSEATSSPTGLIPTQITSTQTYIPTAVEPTIFASSPMPTIDEIFLPGNYDKINLIDQARLVLIPVGEFEMGSNLDQMMTLCESLEGGCDPSDFADEAPVHLVMLDAYYIYQFEVTNTQYRLCVDAGTCPAPAFGEFYNDVRFSQHPVVFVNWFAAEAYCAWAEGRLPSEAEWEYAARGADGRTFPWGEAAECGYGNYSGCTQGLTMPIGSFAEGVSPWGVFDLSGNATEWVGDWYGKYPETSVENPLGPQDGELRVARGGSWKNPLLGVRTTARTANYPDVYSSGTGFRCVIPVE